MMIISYKQYLAQASDSVNTSYNDKYKKPRFADKSVINSNN